jgi:hypothetical protein
MHTIAPLKKVAKFYEEERLVRSRKELGTIHKRRCADHRSTREGQRKEPVGKENIDPDNRLEAISKLFERGVVRLLRQRSREQREHHAPTNTLSPSCNIYFEIISKKMLLSLGQGDREAGKGHFDPAPKG